VKLFKTACLMLFAISAFAATPKVNGFLGNESGVAVARTYPLALNNYSVDQAAFVLLWSSATPGSTTFNDGAVSSATLTVSSSPAQGITGEAVCINQTCLIDGRDWTHSPIGQSSGTAINIAAAINANTTLNQVIIATAPTNSSVVYTTSVVVGTSANFALYASTTAVRWNPANAMIGGRDSSFTINQTVIFSSNPWSPVGKTPMVGLPVVFSTGTSAIGGLTNQTTYYVIPINANAFGLSTTSTGALAGYNELPVVSSTAIPGTFIAFTSSQTKLTADNYTLAATVFAGTPSGLWQVSNDGQNWSTYASSGTVILAPSGGVQQSLAGDFGTINFAFIRFNLNTPPTGGALQFAIEPNGKNSGL
jgi:hypothetical protein